MTRLVSRAEWGATVPTGPAQGQADELWLHHSVTALTGDPHRDMRVIEDIGRQRFGRFSYSYAYHKPTRLWLEGAGRTIGAHTGGRNTRAIGCVVIGNTDTLDLGGDFDDDLVWLIRDRIAAGHLAPVDRANVFDGGAWTTRSYPTGGHRDQKPTACPGSNAYARIANVRQRITANPTKDWFDMATEAEIRTIVAGEVNRAIGAIWTAEAAAVKRHQAIRVLFGSIRGWSAAAAEKLYGDDLGQARDRAVELDDSPKK